MKHSTLSMLVYAYRLLHHLVKQIARLHPFEDVGIVTRDAVGEVLSIPLANQRVAACVANVTTCYHRRMDEDEYLTVEEAAQ